MIEEHNLWVKFIKTFHNDHGGFPFSQNRIKDATTWVRIVVTTKTSNNKGSSSFSDFKNGWKW